MRRITLALFLILFAMVPVLKAQTLDVTLAPNSPPESHRKPDGPTDYPIALFRFFASGGAAQLNGFTLTTSGTGDFALDLASGTGLQAWMDDGNGIFNNASDTQLAAASGSTPTVTLTFGASENIADATSVDVWVVGSFLANNNNKSYGVSIANVGDVDAGSTTVTLGTPAPVSELVWLHTEKGNGENSGNVRCSASTQSRLPSVLLFMFALTALVQRFLFARKTARRIAFTRVPISKTSRRK